MQTQGEFQEQNGIPHDKIQVVWRQVADDPITLNSIEKKVAAHIF